MSTKQLRKKSFGWLSVFCVGICFFLFFFLFYSSAWDKCQFGGLYFFFFFLHNGLAYKWLFWFVFCLISIRFPVSPVFFTTAYYYYHYCYYYCNPKFRSSYHEIYDSFGILLDCIGEYQIELVLAQITTFFFFPLFSIVLLGYIRFAPFVVCDSKRLLFFSRLVFSLFLTFPSKARPGFCLKNFRFHSPSKLFSTSTCSFLVATCILCF